MAGGDDQTYLRGVQYKDSANLAARASLHAKYGTATIAWFEFLAGLVQWDGVGDVLDVGCGTGFVWPAIDAALTHPVNVTLTDLSPGMVSEARDRLAPLAHLDVVCAQVADVQQLPFADASFDVAFANHMLYHVSDRSQTVRELARMLRPDGVLVAATNGRSNMNEVERCARRRRTPLHGSRRHRRLHRVDATWRAHVGRRGQPFGSRRTPARSSRRWRGASRREIATMRY